MSGCSQVVLCVNSHLEMVSLHEFSTQVILIKAFTLKTSILSPIKWFLKHHCMLSRASDSTSYDWLSIKNVKCCLLYLHKPSIHVLINPAWNCFVAWCCCETNSYTLPTIMDLFQKPLLCTMNAFKNSVWSLLDGKVKCFSKGVKCIAHKAWGKIIIYITYC